MVILIYYLFYQANIVEEEVHIPSKHHQSIIGPKGTLIKSIVEDCGGVGIHFPMGKDNADKVRIRGVKEEVEKAKKQLLDIANKRVSSYQRLHLLPHHFFGSCISLEVYVLTWKMKDV